MENKISRQDEINEFLTLVNALTKKYNVSLGVTVIDLTPKVESPTEEIIQKDDA